MVLVSFPFFTVLMPALCHLSQQPAIAGNEHERVYTVYLTYTGISFGTEYTLLYVALSSIYIISSTIL
jgi:hypothetical protein